MYNQYNYTNRAPVTAAWTIARQKIDVKASIGKALGSSQLWEPVQTTWFRAWKQYDYFDGEGDDTR